MHEKHEKWNIVCRLSKQRMSQSSAIAVLQQRAGEPEQSQEGKEYLPSSSLQSVATPRGEP